jgi:hypothetical protein
MSLTEAPISPTAHARPAPAAELKRTHSAAPPAVEASPVGHRRQPRDQQLSHTAKPEHLLLEADEITLKVGNVTLTMSQQNGGTLEIRAPHVRIVGEDVHSEAETTNTIVGENVVSEATMHSDLLGKLIRIDGQFVKINS